MRVSAPQHRSFGRSYRARREAAFTLVEVLVVTGIIAVLIAVIVPALSGGLKTANMAKSQANLKQIATWMQSYSQENRDYIVPSQFDYTVAAATYPVKVRSNTNPPVGNQYQGTWTDILWMYSGLSTHVGGYEFDSPDRVFYQSDPDFDNPFRAAGVNSRDFNLGGGGDPLPFGGGAHESGEPGYFAANNYFNATPGLAANPDTSQPAAGANGRWYATGQIKASDRSMYLVDSFAGETIEPDPGAPGPWHKPAVGQAPQFEVDMRYNGACLMLMLDGHSEAQGPWLDLQELEGCVNPGGNVTQGRNIRIRDLTKSGLPFCP